MSDISAVGAPTTVTRGSDSFSSTALQGIDKEMFLKLLVAQMKYQNPMNPVDSTEFLSQAAQYASVEQLENMATQQAEMRSLQMITVATGMVGNEITAVDAATGQPITGIVTSVQFDGTEPLLVVGNTIVPVTNVIEMRTPTGEPATPGTPPRTSDAASAVPSAPNAADAEPIATDTAEAVVVV